MIEYGLLAGAGGTFMNVVTATFDTFQRTAVELALVVLDHPLVSFAVLAVAVGMIVSRRRR